MELTNAEARWFAARGYVAVVQDCRGCFRSGGDVDFLIPEAEDGADTMTWLAQQSWYDSYTRGSFDLFTSLAACKRAPVRLLMGPWTHGTSTPELTYAGDVDFGEEAALESFRQLHLRWFDRWMRGVDNGLDREAPLRLFVMGGGSGRRLPGGRLDHGGVWRDEHEWPLARSVFTDYYLHEDGGLATTEPAQRDSSTTYRFDPARPVPSCGGNVSSLREIAPLPPGIAEPEFAPRTHRQSSIMQPGGFDQVETPDMFGTSAPYLPLGSRADVLVFQSAPLESPTEVTGPVEVHLWVATSALDTDFTAKLIDVYPPSPWYPRGYALNLTDSILRLRYRNGFDRPEPATPGEAVTLTITLYPTSNLFMPGHRIRLDISSSNSPRFDVNPNTGEPIGRDRRRVVADNTVFHEWGRASRVVLPIVAPITG